ncbi:ABC-type multidrug transport system ATPase subunit [Paenibacillus mucilaginosus]
MKGVDFEVEKGNIFALSSCGRLLNRCLTDAADRKVSAYSGGMRRRLDIALSLGGEHICRVIDHHYFIEMAASIAWPHPSRLSVVG